MRYTRASLEHARGYGYGGMLTGIFNIFGRLKWYFLLLEENFNQFGNTFKRQMAIQRGKTFGFTLCVYIDTYLK